MAAEGRQCRNCRHWHDEIPHPERRRSRSTNQRAQPPRPPTHRIVELATYLARLASSNVQTTDRSPSTEHEKAEELQKGGSINSTVVEGSTAPRRFS